MVYTGGDWMGYQSFNEWYDPSQNQWTVLTTPFIGQWRDQDLAAIGNDNHGLGGWGRTVSNHRRKIQLLYD